MKLSSSESPDLTPAVAVMVAEYGLISIPDNALGLPAEIAKEILLTMEEFKTCKAGSPAFHAFSNKKKPECTVPIKIGNGFTDTFVGDGIVRGMSEMMNQCYILVLTRSLQHRNLPSQIRLGGKALQYS